ncbi:MAG: sigma-70 family RNA polymerase sigma factor [Bacteroidetes bacterium]|nr:sigma-70 family RNA polymerase sigma factor [Bacteroidota bacterium]
MWFRNKKHISDYSDTELIGRYKECDDNQCIGILYERYAHLVYSICYKYLQNEDECKDGVLAIFEKLFTDLKKYEINNFGSWLHSVTRNYCLAVQKKESLKVPLNEQTTSHTELAIQDDAAILDQYMPHLHEALHTIKKPQQECVRLFYLEKKSYVEISNFTGYSLKEVKSHIQNGKRNLKIYLEQKRNA